MLAAAHGHTATLELLHRLGANVNAADKVLHRLSRVPGVTRAMHNHRLPRMDGTPC